MLLCGRIFLGAKSSSIKYTTSKDQKEFMCDFKTVYEADTKELAESQLIELDEKWSK